MKISVLHDNHGHILGISRISDLKSAGSKFVKAGMLPGKDQHVIELELTGEDKGRSLKDLHNLYRVDSKSRQFIKK